MNLNFKIEDKNLITSEKNHNYRYYEFTEDTCKTIASKHVNDVDSDEWYSLVQMLYPNRLICSGLFESFLAFEIRDGKRIDPPMEHWGNLVSEGSDGVLLHRIIDVLNSNCIEEHPSWAETLKAAEEK